MKKGLLLLGPSGLARGSRYGALKKVAQEKDRPPCSLPEWLFSWVPGEGDEFAQCPEHISRADEEGPPGGCSRALSGVVRIPGNDGLGGRPGQALEDEEH